MMIDKKHILGVAEEIRRQLVGLTAPNVLMSWGISRLAASVIDNMPALRFKVNGRLHKGEVFIALNEGLTTMRFTLPIIMANARLPAILILPSWVMSLIPP